MTRRVRAAASLLGPTAKLVPWAHVCAGTVLAFGVVSAVRGNEWADVPAVVHAVRVGAVAIAVSLAFVFDDPTEAMLAGTPVTVAVRRSVRLVVVLPLVALLWVGLLWWAWSTPAIQQTTASWPGLPLPVSALTLEVGALAAVALASSAVSMWRSRSTTGGLVAGPAGLAAAAALLLLPPSLALWVPYAPAPPVNSVTDARWLAWVAAHQRWAALIVFGLLGIALWSRDRARVRGRHRLIARPRRP